MRNRFAHWHSQGGRGGQGEKKFLRDLPDLPVMAFCVLFGVGVLAQSPPSKSLQIYVTGVEGGNATLFVTPSGESVLIDTGNPGARDADRIAAAAKDA